MTWQDRANRMAASAVRRLGNAVTIDGVSGFGILQSPEERIYEGAIVTTDFERVDNTSSSIGPLSSMNGCCSRIAARRVM